MHEHPGRAKVLAGGTDLLGLMKDRIAGPKMPMPTALVNIKRVPGLKTITNSKDESVVGACVTLTEASADPTLSQRFPGFVQAASSVGTTQIRNMGTVGGNLCQRPWCWYFRHPEFSCFKKGGRQCFAITGDNSTYFSTYNIGTCIMAHPSDTAPALTSLGARVRVAPYGGEEKVIPIDEFFLGPRSVHDNVLKEDELLVNVTIPYDDPRRKSVYIKHRPRNNWDFALVSVAASGVMDDSGIVQSAKVVLGGVATAPFVVEGVNDALAGRALTKGSGEEVGGLVARGAKPLRMNRYKVRIAKALVQRALWSIFNKD